MVTSAGSLSPLGMGASGDEAHVAGALVHDQLDLAREMLDADAVAQAIDALSPRAREELDALLPVSWCTLSTAQELHERLAAATDQDVHAWHKRIVRVGVERTLSTFWRLMMRVVSTEGLVRRAGMVYARSYDRGTLDARLVRAGVVEAVLSEWPDVPDFELEGIVIAFDVALHLAGVESVSVKYERQPSGLVRFDIHFRA